MFHGEIGRDFANAAAAAAICKFPAELSEKGSCWFRLAKIQRATFDRIEAD